MKKIILTTLVTTGLALGAFAQGSLTGLGNLNTCITTVGANATDPNNATTWYTGNITLEVFYCATASATLSQINAINAFNGVSGVAALNLLTLDGFTEASSTTLTGTTIGGVTCAIDGGYFSSSTPKIGLAGAPASTTGWLAFVAIASGGVYDGSMGVLAFANATGGNPSASPAGTAATITGLDPLGVNLVLTPVPEPCTMALLGLGGLSLLVIRRRK